MRLRLVHVLLRVVSHGHGHVHGHLRRSLHGLLRIYAHLHVLLVHQLLCILLHFCSSVLEPILHMGVSLALQNVAGGWARRLTLILSRGTPRLSAKPFFVLVLGLWCCWKWRSRMSCCSLVLCAELVSAAVSYGGIATDLQTWLYVGRRWFPWRTRGLGLRRGCLRRVRSLHSSIAAGGIRLHGSGGSRWEPQKHSGAMRGQQRAGLFVQRRGWWRSRRSGVGLVPLGKSCRIII